jgi:RHS repeat-associated protein
VEQGRRERVIPAQSRRLGVYNTAIQAGALWLQAYTPDGLVGAVTDANSHSTSYAYDGLDRLGTSTWPDSSTEVLGYDADSNVLTRKTRKGDTVTLTYDTLNRLKTKSAPSEASVTYAYDLVGRMTGASDASAAVVAPATSASYTASYSYDAINRPLGVSWSPAPAQTLPSPASVSFTHRYDPTNRRIGQSASDNGWWSYPTTAASVGYTANALNQYSAVGAATPTYDGNGNLTYDGSFTYGYDAESRLTGITQGASSIASYAFDAQGRRKLRTVGAAKTAYVTDADNREVLEYDGTTGALQAWYAFGLGLDTPLNRMNVAGSSRQTLIPDIQGSIIGLLDSGGSLTKAGYQPFGENPALTTAGFRYTARRLDPETAGSAAEPSGLYYYRARMYSPAWGRFLQPDPVGYGGGANLYVYVSNDPLDQVDPTGQIGSCKGALCGSIPAALALIHTGNVSNLITPFQQIKLSTASNFLDGSNVNVVFAKPCNGCAGGALADPSRHSVTVILDPQQFSGPGGSADIGKLAEVLVHEGGGHGFDLLEIGRQTPRTLTQETWTESNAYELQQTFNQAVDRTSSWPGLWEQGWTTDTNAGQAKVGLDYSVSQSVNVWTQNYKSIYGSPRLQLRERENEHRNSPSKD